MVWHVNAKGYTGNIMTLKRINQNEIFDTSLRMKQVNTLRETLRLPLLEIPSEDTADTIALPTIGLEVEMTWRQAMQDMHERWLNAPDSPNDHDPRSETYRTFDRAYDQNNDKLMPLLHSVTPVIPRVGSDAYWEFSFLPVKNTSVADAELSTLYDANILFEDIPYATHMTIAGIPSTRDAYAILCLLEQAGGTTKTRLDSARTTKKGTWTQKGAGGLRHRTAGELEGSDTTAYEFRTLVTTSPEQMQRLVTLGQEMAHLCLTHPTAWKQTRATVENSLKTRGLPLKSWAAPKYDPLTWQGYHELIHQ